MQITEACLSLLYRWAYCRNFSYDARGRYTTRGRAEFTCDKRASKSVKVRKHFHQQSKAFHACRAPPPLPQRAMPMNHLVPIRRSTVTISGISTVSYTAAAVLGLHLAEGRKRDHAAACIANGITRFYSAMHVMQRTVLLSKFCPSVRLSVKPVDCDKTK